jgi:hypothetical protein
MTKRAGAGCPFFSPPPPPPPANEGASEPLAKAGRTGRLGSAAHFDGTRARGSGGGGSGDGGERGGGDVDVKGGVFGDRTSGANRLIAGR